MCRGGHRMDAGTHSLELYRRLGGGARVFLNEPLWAVRRSHWENAVFPYIGCILGVEKPTSIREGSDGCSSR